MKINYLAQVIALSFIGGLTLASCSTTAVDPCAGKSNGTASSTKTDPCAGKKKVETAASETSVGNPLAKEIQTKPVVVYVHASWCAACKNIAPTIAQFKQKYAGKVEFVTLDVTNKADTSATEAMAKKLGLDKFFKENQSKTASVAIVDPVTGNISATYQNNPNLDEYVKVTDEAIAKFKPSAS
jgi:thiol-disulfide isomerase/thioredoxin